MQLYIELAINAPEDAEGFTQGILHAEQECVAISRDDSPANFTGIWPVTLGRRGEPFNIKLGRGAWVKVRGDGSNRCPQCYPASPFTYQEIVDTLDEKHYGHPAGNQSWLGLELPILARLFKIPEAEVLQVMREVASRYRRKPDERHCKSCGMPIQFRNNTPHDRSGKNHFIACPNRAAHRRK